MSQIQKRAQKLRVKAAVLRATEGLTISDIADNIGYSTEYTGAVLRGKYESPQLCDAFEQFLKNRKGSLAAA